jgi:hypothetical protein
MSNVAQLKDRIIRGTNHLYEDQFHMLDLINDGVSNMMDAAKIIKRTTISAVVGTNVYPLPADFKAPSNLQDETNDNYVINYDLVDISENRYGYAIESGFIYLKPSPLENKVLTHYYYNYAANLVNDSDIPTEIDAQYHNVIALYAISMIIPLVKKDTSTRYAVMANNLAETRAWQMYQDGLQGFIRANAKKNKNSRAREKVVW